MSDQPQSSPGPTPQNPAVAHCANAWQRTYDLTSLLPKRARQKKDYDSFAEDEAKHAFRDAMPPLTGYQNIQDQIACIGYALLHGIFLKSECEGLLNCAKFALTALHAEPRSPRKENTSKLPKFDATPPEPQPQSNEINDLADNLGVNIGG